MLSQLEKLEKGILECLPQLPFIIDQVGAAISWVKQDMEESKALKTLQVAERIAQIAVKNSDPNFFKTRLVLAALLSEIPNVLTDERFARFESSSGSVEKTVQDVTIDQDSIEKKGCFKAMTLHLVSLANKDEESLTIMLVRMLNDLQEIISGMKEVGVKAPITPKDYVTVLGYALVLSNMRMSNLKLKNYNSDIVNEISIILNQELSY